MEGSDLAILVAGSAGFDSVTAQSLCMFFDVKLQSLNSLEAIRHPQWILSPSDASVGPFSGITFLDSVMLHPAAAVAVPPERALAVLRESTICDS